MCRALVLASSPSVPGVILVDSVFQPGNLNACEDRLYITPTQDSFWGGHTAGFLLGSSLLLHKCRT